MSNDQLLTHAIDQHKDTTATAKRALRVVQDTQQLVQATTQALHDQGEQMERIETGLDKVRVLQCLTMYGV